MIVDNLKTSMTDYGFIGPLFVKAFAWLSSNNLESLEPGQVVEIDGKRVTAQIQSYTTGNSGDLSFESHRSFIDIQYVVQGQEVIEWAPLALLTQVTKAYDPDKDIGFYGNPSQLVRVELHPGDFAVFFPSDGHKPKCSLDNPQLVKKIVIKISVQ